MLDRDEACGLVRGLDRLIRRVAFRVTRTMGRRMAAQERDDLIQEGWLALLESRENIDVEAKPEAWMHFRVLGGMRDHQRRQFRQISLLSGQRIFRIDPSAVAKPARRRSTHTQPTVYLRSLLTTAAPNPEKTASRNERSRQVREILNALPAQHRELLVRCYVDEEKVEDIASSLRVHVWRVRHELEHAKEAFLLECARAGLS